MNPEQGDGPQESGSKRNTLENLSQEELIKKCRVFLDLARKAKQTKDEYSDENKRLKDEVCNFETQREADKKSLMAMKEVVDALTEDKLSQISKITDLENAVLKYKEEIKKLQGKCESAENMAIKNEALKRQLQRLSTENEELLESLDKMESKLEQVNKYGVQQQKDLILLEQETAKWKELELNLESARIELMSCHTENAKLKETLSRIQTDKKSNEDLTQELHDCEKTIEQLQQELIKLSSENRDINSDNCCEKECENCRELNIQQNLQLEKLQETEKKHYAEMQAIKTKLIDVTFKFKKLKKCREILLTTLHDYNESIPKWQWEIKSTSIQLSSQVNFLCNTKLALEEKVTKLELEMKQITDSRDFYHQKLQDLIENCERAIVEEEAKICNANKVGRKDQFINALAGGLRTGERVLDTEKNDREHIENELIILREQNQSLTVHLESMSNKIEQLQTNLSTREVENADLLLEMRELNEILKGRGDVISRQQSKIAQLEEEVKKANEILYGSAFISPRKEPEISQYEENTAVTEIGAKRSVHLKENEKLVLDEGTMIREKIPDAQTEVLSTSTVSRLEESARMKEVDESLEEKYSKLRSLAIKLKRKVKEQAAQITLLESNNKRSSVEKNEVMTKLGTISLQVRNLQALQNENDKLLDEIESLKSEKLKADSRIKELNEGLQAITQRKNSAEGQVDQNVVKILRQERDGLKEEKETLKREIIAKEKELTSLRDQYEKVREELEKFKASGKQNNVLSLEIKAYEKSLNDAIQQLQEKQNLLEDLQKSLKDKEEYVQSVNKELNLLEESLESEKEHSLELKQQIDIQQQKFKENEYEKSELRAKFQDINVQSENLKSQVDELNLQLSELVREKDKILTVCRNEKESLSRQTLELEENLSVLKSKLKITERELEDVKAEYANYKVRAQSILRQNQSKESGRERELEEEVIIMRSTIETLNLEVASSREALQGCEKKMEEVREDNERIQKRCKDLMQLLEESRMQIEAVLNENKKQSVEYQESLKAHRLQIETLNNCYKKQVDDLEKKHSAEIEELKKRGNISSESKMISRIGPFGGPVSSDEQKIDLILMEREDAEGSEAGVPITHRRVSSVRGKHDLMPLDELLNSSLNEDMKEEQILYSSTKEMQATKEKLQVQESRVKHLTSLLSEAEQDLFKLTQLNEMLKKEVRRHERAVEREKHIQNSEYLKNVIIKFLTLNCGDERSRLVPVLSTMLKLSPEEMQTLQNVAKGLDFVPRSWSSFLPIWSNHQ